MGLIALANLFEVDAANFAKMIEGREASFEDFVGKSVPLTLTGKTILNRTPP
jgi:hypothetical protein